MTPIRLALKARRFFPNAPKSQVAKQAVAYAKAVLYLGEKYIVLKQHGKLDTPRPV